MNYAQIRAFHRVATEGSFSKAAASLHVTQPTISAQVRELEETHGVRLFDRRRRQVRPTESGVRLLALTHRLFDLEAEISELLEAGRALDTGHLSIGTDSPTHTLPLLAAFTRAHPGVSPSLATGNADEMLGALLDYRTDVAVIAKKIDDPRVEIVELRRDPLVLFTHRDHELATNESVPLGAVRGLRLILREEGSVTGELFRTALSEHGVEPASVMDIDSREAVHEAVAAGLGVGVVARSEVANDPRLRCIPIADAKLIMTEYVVCLAERRRLPIVRAFLDLAKDRAGGGTGQG
jgi:aminoethylphosphonate catabolism LysR family transcriptional regulator